MAENLTRRCYQGKGYLKGQTAAPGLEAGIIEAIDLANTRPRTRSDRTYWAKRFVLWLAECYPAARTWADIRPVMLQRYIASMEQGEKPKAHDTVRLAVAPVKLTWRHMAANYPDLVKPMPGSGWRPRPGGKSNAWTRASWRPCWGG